MKRNRLFVTDSRWERDYRVVDLNTGETTWECDFSVDGPCPINTFNVISEGMVQIQSEFDGEVNPGSIFDPVTGETTDFDVIENVPGVHVSEIGDDYLLMRWTGAGVILERNGT